MWTIDPIDGTKGFLRGEQYAVCLSLIVDSIVQVGVIGCPNLPINPQSSEKGTGCIFVAVRGQGARQVRSHLFPFCHRFIQMIVPYSWLLTAPTLPHWLSLLLRPHHSTSLNLSKLLTLPIPSMIECLLYSVSHDLPLAWIAKRNTAALPEETQGLTSVCQQVWDILKRSG